jgi:tetratricopeptide (TPR) repeat protein
MLKAKQFRTDGQTHNAAVVVVNAMKDGGRNEAQAHMLAADLFVAKDAKGDALRVSSDALLGLGANRFALVSAEAALKLAKKGTAEAADCLSKIGTALAKLGKHDDAMEKFKEALEIRMKVFGKEHADVAMCYGNMGNVLQKQGKYDDAMEKYEAALQIMKKVFGEEHADVASCYNNMGNVLREQGKHEEAMEKYEAALLTYKKMFGEEHADVAMCYNNMGAVLQTQGKHEAAMEKYEAALQILKNVYGADSADYSSALLKLASYACVTKSSLDDSHLLAELRRIVDVDVHLFNSVSPSVFAFGLRDHIKLLRLTARFGQCAREMTALKQWRANVQRLINVPHPVVRAIGLQELVAVRADGRFASATACESERLLAALRASASPCALREATGAREQLLSSLFVDEAGARQAQMRAVAAHSLSLLGLDGLELVDDDLVAQLMRARVLEHEVLHRCAGELSDVEAHNTSSWTRNSVADVFVLLLNVLDQAFARLAVASGATGDKLYFPCKGSTDALFKAAGFAQLAADIQQRIEAQQPFSFFKDASRDFGESEWLHLTSQIANDNKHIKLSQHVHSATLKDKSRGTIEQRDVTLNVSASGPSPDLTNWTLYLWPALVEAARDDAERRAVSRLARKFLTGLERGDDGNTAAVGGVAKNKYLEHYHGGAYDLFFVPAPIAAMDDEALRRELVKDLQAFDGAQGSQLSRFVDEIKSFLRMRIDWQTPSKPLAEASNEAQIDLVALMRRAIDNTCKLVVAMVDERVKRGRAAIKSGVDMFAPVDWLALSDAGARDVVARGVDEVRASAWSVVDDLAKNLLADSEFAASASAYQRLHAIGCVLENVDDVGAFAKLWERVIDRVKASDSELARSLAPLFAVRLRDTLVLRATTSELSQLMINIYNVTGSFKIELPSLAGVEVDADLVAQLQACVVSARNLRVQSLQLRCGDGRDVLLRNEMSVTLSVALGKCRAVLEHAFTRFARLHVWAHALPPPAPHEVFQAKFAVGQDTDSFRANLLRQLCRADEPDKMITELFPGVDASVWQALEAEQGYKLGGGAWVDELVSVVNESKHERVRLVDDALLQAWWARGDVKSVDASFPLFVRDERFYTWSFARECGGDAVASSALFKHLCDNGALAIETKKHKCAPVTFGHVLDGALKDTIDESELRRVMREGGELRVDDFDVCNKWHASAKNNAFKANLQHPDATKRWDHVADLIAIGWLPAGTVVEDAKKRTLRADLLDEVKRRIRLDSKALVGELVSDGSLVDAGGGKFEVRQCELQIAIKGKWEKIFELAKLDKLCRDTKTVSYRHLVACRLGAVSEADAQARVQELVGDLQLLFGWPCVVGESLDETLVIQAAINVGATPASAAAVLSRLQNAVRTRRHEEQVVDASVFVGGIEFVERCVQGAARVVAALARASAESAQPSGSAAAPAAPVAPTVVVSRSNADDDDDADDGSVGKQKLRRGRK